MRVDRRHADRDGRDGDGRRGGGDAIAAFSANGRTPRWAHAGWVSVIGCFLILGFYSVIAGWALKYFIGALTGDLWRVASDGYGGFFGDFIANGAEPVAWQFAAIAATMLVVMGGVRRGIEAANRILMPLLALVVIVLAVYASTLSGSAAGWKFLFVPDWAAFGEPQVYIAAVGQAFFSLGIGMAVFITYASYMTPDIKIPAPRPRSSPGIPFSRLSPGSPFFRPCSRSAATRRPARNSPSSRCRRFF
jgi:NSS family neurotransmitter:Na+ symporter